MPAQLPKLTGSNYNHWSIQMRVLYESQEFWQLVEEGYREPAEGTPAQMNEFRENKKKDKKALFLLYQCHTPDWRVWACDRGSNTTLVQEIKHCI